MGHGISRVGAVRHIIEAGRNCDQLHCGLYRERSIRGWSICLDGRLGLSCARLGPIGQIAQQTARPTERRLRSVQCTANPAQFNPFVDSAAELCDNSARNAGHQPCDQAFPHPRGWGGGKLDICTLLVRGCPIIYRPPELKLNWPNEPLFQQLGWRCHNCRTSPIGSMRMSRDHKVVFALVTMIKYGG